MTAVRLTVLTCLALAALIWPVSASAASALGFTQGAGALSEPVSLVVLGGVLLGVSSRIRRTQ